MSFPHHDPDWIGAADFVRAHRRAGETILAPDAFVFRFERIYRYANTALRPEARYDWAALHTWMLHDLAPSFLARVGDEMRPVFANDAFVVWSRSTALGRLGFFNRHLRRFRRARRLADRTPPPAPPPAFDLPDAGIMEDFAHLSRPAIKTAMDRLFIRGGYRTPTLRDRTYMAEMDRCCAELMGDLTGKRILDLCCGDGRVAGMAETCAELVGVDLAEVPLRTMAGRWAHRPHYRFAAMAAEQLALPDASFDVVTFIEASEHVVDIEATLREIARVSRPGARLVVTSQNADSLHLIVNRKLGYPNFFTSYQHFREFTPAQLTALLGAHGFAVEQSRGIWLSPYWEIPGIDRHVRRATDDDPELVEAMHRIGRRIGADHAHTFMLSARKMP